MNGIQKGDVAIRTLKECSALLDGSLLSLRLFEEMDAVVCELVIKPRAGSLISNVVLRIESVKRFDFYYDNRTGFYLIDRYKLFLCENGDVYLSLDPYIEDESELENDCGVIIGREIVLIR